MSRSNGWPLVVYVAVSFTVQPYAGRRAGAPSAEAG